MSREIRLTALGGLGEIGKNLMMLESDEDAILIDCGLAFPHEDMLGVDLVIPDIGYVKKQKRKLRGIVLTHGHEDHVGALPWVLKEVNVPVYGTKLTLGLARRKINEVLTDGGYDFRTVSPRDVVSFGGIRVEFFRVTHSVSDSCGLIIYTDAGILVHTGDFKLDQTPIDGEVFDYHRLAEVGERGVLALLSDSTHADRPGFTPSERDVGEALFRIFSAASNRIIVTTFASNVPRIQQVIDTASYFGRKVAVVGRSMENVVEVALALGYLKAPIGTLVDVEDLDKYPPSKMVILSTGSQGEPLSALHRMSLGEHRHVEIDEGDLVIMAATPVPGNETMVSQTVDNLFRRGARVIYTPESGVHVSGHSSQEELKLILNLVKPRFFIPIHGEYRHLVIHGELAQQTGVAPSRVLIGENGSVFRLTPDRGEIVDVVPTGGIMLDNVGLTHVSEEVLKERRVLAEAGIITISVVLSPSARELASEPSVESRGFMYNTPQDGVLQEISRRTRSYFQALPREVLSDLEFIRHDLEETVTKYVHHETGVRPLVTVNICQI
ncbi:MAG TPA: ribonuclease J [Firmicutes bacterium]|nr:ribonuclease J [Candidatus Fermentithermobacillaceae bacterium]